MYSKVVNGTKNYVTMKCSVYQMNHSHDWSCLRILIKWCSKRLWEGNMDFKEEMKRYECFMYVCFYIWYPYVCVSLLVKTSVSSMHVTYICRSKQFYRYWDKLALDAYLLRAIICHSDLQWLDSISFSFPTSKSNAYPLWTKINGTLERNICNCYGFDN